MAIVSPIRIEGLAEFQAKLAALPFKVREQVARTVLERAAQPIALAATQNARRIYGHRHGNSFTWNIEVSKTWLDSEGLHVEISPKGGWFAGDWFYAGFLEWGFLHSSIKRHGGKKHRKVFRKWQATDSPGRYYAGKLFATKAADEKAAEAVALLFSQVDSIIDQHMRSATKVSAGAEKAWAAGQAGTARASASAEAADFTEMMSNFGRT